MDKKNLFQIFLVMAGFIVSYFMDKILFSIDPNWASWLPDSPFMWHFTWFILRLTPPVLITVILLKKQSLNALGLSKDFPKAFLFAVLFTLPLFAGFAVLAEFNPEVTLMKVFSNCVFPGFYEELLIRSFLVGLLFRYFRWGFIPASLTGALFFGAWHLYQGHDFAGSMFAFLVTALGSVWFGWLYIEWRFNAWINISLHTLMNLSWLLFSITGGAAGDIISNILRAITIIATVVVTLKVFSLKKGFIINRNTLWINRSTE